MTEDEKALQAAFELVHKDPVNFVRDVIGIEPQPWQCDFMRAVRDQRQVAVRSGVNTGKTAATAWIIIWYLLTHFPVKLGVSGPSLGQLKTSIIAELQKTIRLISENGFPKWANSLTLTTEGLRNVNANGEAFAEFRVPSAEKPESLRGLHCKGGTAIWFIDEASSVSDDSLEAMLGVLSDDDGKVVMISNPTRLKGEFFNAFYTTAHLWTKFHVNYRNSTLVSALYVENMRASKGVDSREFRIQVEGDFPLVDEDTLIPRQLVEDATRRKVDPISGPIIWGVDCATTGGGDRIALVKRQMNVVRGVKAWPGRDPMGIVKLVEDEYRSEDDKHKPDEIIVDSNGVGAGVVSRLRELGYPARGINVGERARDPDRYMRLRDELWDAAKTYLEARDCKLPSVDPTKPEHEELVFELSSPLYHIDDSSRKLKVEGKQEMRKRIKGSKSPDLADAFIHSLYNRSGNKRFGSRSINERVDVSYVV